MLYNNYLKSLKICPFCILKKEEILKGNKYALLTLAKAPYTEDHLLVIPKRHVLSMLDLTDKEEKDIKDLQIFGLKFLHKKYKNVSILMREGNKIKVGKSIDHLHFHLIPNMQIGSTDINLNKRQILDDKNYLRKISKIKKDLILETFK